MRRERKIFFIILEVFGLRLNKYIIIAAFAVKVPGINPDSFFTRRTCFLNILIMNAQGSINLQQFKIDVN